MLGEALSDQEIGMHHFQHCLKDGQVLCKLVFFSDVLRCFIAKFEVLICSEEEVSLSLK